MEPTDLDTIAALATTALGDLAPQVAVVGLGGVTLVTLFTLYGVVTRIVKSRGKNAG